MSDDDPAGGGAPLNPVPKPPPPPDPSTDPGLPPLPTDCSDDVSPGSITTDQDADIFLLRPKEAMSLLAAALEHLAAMTGDVPPTPPPPPEKSAQESTTHLREMHKEKVGIVRSHSARSLARMREEAERTEREQSERRVAGDSRGEKGDERDPFAEAAAAAVSRQSLRRINGVTEPAAIAPAAVDEDGLPGLKKNSSSFTARKAPKPPHIIVGEDSQPLNIQHGIITRKFYARVPPPISIADYLIRIHRYLPMSTAVYLATSLYIHRLAVEERAIAVTHRNAHRLVLAGLRVAMKALEDQSYDHGRFAAVGGVKKLELARLEVGFCFLTGFELGVNKAVLTEHLRALQDGTKHDWANPPDGQGLKLTMSRLRIQDG